MLAIGMLVKNHIIPLVNVRTIFGHIPTSDIFLDRDLPNFSDIGRTRTDIFLKLSPLASIPQAQQAELHMSELYLNQSTRSLQTIESS